MLAVLDALKSELSVAVEDQDKALALILRQASAAVETYCRRRFGLHDAEARIVHLRRPAVISDPGPLILPEWPVAGAPSVTREGAPVDGASIDIERTAGLLFRLDEAGERCGWPPGRYRVRYRAGYVLPGDAAVEGAEPLPDDLQRGVVLLAATMWHARGRDPAVRIDASPDVGSTTYGRAAAGDGGLPGHVTAWLNPYRGIGL